MPLTPAARELLDRLDRAFEHAPDERENPRALAIHLRAELEQAPPEPDTDEGRAARARAALRELADALAACKRAGIHADVLFERRGGLRLGAEEFARSSVEAGRVTVL